MTAITHVYRAMPAAVTAITADFRGASFGAIVDAAGVDVMVANMAAQMAERGLSREDARRWVVTTLMADEQMRDPRVGDRLMQTCLWMACTGERGELVAAMARRGGHTIGYEIIAAEAPGGACGLNFRLLAGASEHHPMQHLIPRDLEAAGSA